jgi:zinc/manganese transport system substrate-binding protein
MAWQCSMVGDRVTVTLRPGGAADLANLIENDYRFRVITISRAARVAATAFLTVPFALVACSPPEGSGSQAGTAPAGGQSSAAADCPTTPVDVVVSVDQWGDIVSELGGKCANVKTVLASSSIDPHDYEPSPADAASFTGAKLIVVNGADYDPWASKLAATSAPDAPVVSAGEVTKTAEGANPHLWYSPSAVTSVADAVTAELSKLNPEATSYFADQRSAFRTAMAPFAGLIDEIKAKASGKSYSATEGIFDYQAQALGLVDETPAGYQTASENESDPSPADLEAFLGVLTNHQVDVLIYNTQTEGSVPEQLRSAAEQGGVPVVEVTETVAPGKASFESWQIEQLTALAKALGVAV